MIRTVKFVSDVNFTRQNDYCLCHRPSVHVQVIISFRLKEIIEQQDWSQVLPEDVDELRSLRELGFVEECSFF